jgi:RNA recognition motif-containing protein
VRVFAWFAATNTNTYEICCYIRNSKLLDDDEDMNIQVSMKVSKPWAPPLLLPERETVTQPLLNSPEHVLHESRLSSIARIFYASDFDVPLSPDPLSDVEQALDMTSQASAVVSVIPFFAPQLTQPVVATLGSYVEATADIAVDQPPNAPTIQDGKASFEYVQSIGLPLYLVGQPIEVLQSLAGNPSLLSTLRDSNGLYDQQKLLTLAQTLSSASSLPNSMASSYQPQSVNDYGITFNATSYTEPAPFSSQNSRVVARKSDGGNLHVSGYGPGITESDIIAAFSPYVRVDEVVLKGMFAFVNTSDPTNAQRAREALTGTLLNGMPIRINNATRKVRDGSNPFSTPTQPTTFPSFAPPRQSTFGSQAPLSVPPATPGLTHPAFGSIHPNIDSVRDDRGNPPTKNLFVAGYGPGTNEQMLRDLFGQFVVVTGVVSKGSFAFVNTDDRHGALVARESLNGTMYNGGILRINFAKETGRLGTSFDLTYGPNTGPNVNVNVNRIPGTTSNGRPPNIGYYGIN